MFPLRDSQRSRRFPIVTWILILINIAVFLGELSMSPAGLEGFVERFGLVPALVPAAVRGGVHVGAVGDVALRFFSCMFIHGGWAHIIGNLWVLWIFGDNVEDRMGRWRYLGFYLLCGLVAGATQVATGPYSRVPTIGASGAIAGVLGAYFVMFPRARVLTLWPFFFLPLFIELPAVIFLGGWFLLQVVAGQSLLASGEAGGIAFWAHVGGFAFGVATHRLFLWRRGRR